MNKNRLPLVKKIFIICTLFYYPLFSSSSQNITLKYRSDCGYYDGLYALGDTLIIANGDFIEFYDMSDVSSPKLISKLWINCRGYDFFLDSCYLFCSAGYDGLYIIDISSMENPNIINQRDSVECWDVRIFGDHLITASGKNLDIFDISDITNLERKVSLNYLEIGTSKSLEKLNQYLFVGTSGNGLVIFDLSDPGNPIKICNILESISISDICLINNKLFIWDDTERMIRIFDISDISSPNEISYINGYTSGNHFDYDSTFLFIGDLVIDISNVNYPGIVAKLSKNYNKFCVLEKSSLLIGTSGGSADFIDISNPNNPVNIQTTISSQKINVSTLMKYKNTLFTEAHNYGITAWDISEKNNPKIIDAWQDTDGDFMGVISNRLFFSTNYTLEIYNIKNSMFLEYLLSSCNFTGITFNRDVAYGICRIQNWNGNGGYTWQNNLYTLDISQFDDNKLYVVDKQYMDAGTAIAVNDSVLYVVDRNYKLLIYDVKNPKKPKYIKQENIGRCDEIIVDRNFLYKNEISYEEGGGGIDIYDISRPAYPNKINRIKASGTHNYPRHINISQNFLYFYDIDTVKLYDITTPSNPMQVGFYPDKNIDDIVVDDNYIYCAKGIMGFIILKNELADSTMNLIQLSMTKPETFDCCSVDVDILVDFLTDADYFSFEIDIEGDFNTLVPLSVLLSPENQELANWEIETNVSSNEISIAAAGTDTLYEDGKLVTITFYVDTTSISFFPLEFKKVWFGENCSSINTLNGGIYIKPRLIPGDVSLNGEVHAEDAALILKHVVNLDTLDSYQLLNADVTLDSSVSAMDATMILKYCVGSIDTLPYPGPQDSLLASLTLGLYEDFLTPDYVYTIPLSFYQYRNVKSCEVVITYPSECLEYKRTIINQEIDNYEINDKINGKIIIAFAKEIPSSDYYSPFEIEFQAKDCETSIDIIADKLRVNENVLYENEKIGFLFHDAGIEQDNIPKDFHLSQNYPNPFNYTTVISYDLPVNTNIRIDVYDISGKLVDTIIDNFQNAGKYNIIWDAHQLSSGLYFYQIQTDNYKNIKKSILIK